MIRRAMLLDERGLQPSSAFPGSIVFANKSNESLIIVKEEDFEIADFPAESFEPIGIVVIPSSHGVLKDGDGLKNQCGVMSLVPMWLSRPETGGTSAGSLQLGYYYPSGNDNPLIGKTDGLNRFDSVAIDIIAGYNQRPQVVNTPESQTILKGRLGTYLPRQSSIGATPTWNNNSSIPSPYVGEDMKSGEYNSAYGDTFNVLGNQFSDYKSIVNTKILTDYSTAVNWKTLDTLPEYSADFKQRYSPAACCCARYHTLGTKAFKDCSDKELYEGSGFWYLPSLGELGYILPRLADINNTINKLKAAYGIGVALNGEYWSSTWVNNSYICYINVNNGLASHKSGHEKIGTIPFMRL